MYKVLVVDDEIYAVKGLVSGMDWQSLGVDEVHEAYHSRMAQEVLQQHNIDMMICDIEMPEGNGLELMQWVNENAPHVETVVLTCHAEFSYAQKALQLGGSDYLLKPVIFPELAQVLERMKTTIEQKRHAVEADRNYQKYAKLWNNHKPLLIERFWQDLLSQRILPNRQAIETALVTYELKPALLQRIGLIHVSIEQWEKELNDRDEEIMVFALRNAAAEMVLAADEGCVLTDDAGNLIVVVYMGERALSSEELQRRCESFIRACNRYFYCRLSCYIGEPVAVTDIMKAYHELLNAEYRNVARTNEAIRLNELRQRERSDGPEVSAFMDWADTLERGERAEMEALILAELHRLRGKAPTVETLTSFYHAFLQVVYYVLHRRGLSVQLLYEDQGAADVSAATRSLGHFEMWIKRMVATVSETLALNHPSNSIVANLKTFIAAHLDQELTREDLAAHVHLNPAYLSRLFRKETGIVLSDYILQERMKKAADLLVSTNKTISEVADSLGYGNFSYFARLFRKVHGIAPHDYRKAKK
ncbi:response regulator [Paenibacillus athensensis]|nr:response regulator [Paenibacillus athensensis]MCD1260334.1 response regulator [Paenibacillus athensensis]